MASAGGVRVLRAIVLSANTSVSNWLCNLGATESYEGGEYRLDLIVHHDRAPLRRTPSGTNLMLAIETVETAIGRMVRDKLDLDGTPVKWGN